MPKNVRMPFQFWVFSLKGRTLIPYGPNWPPKYLDWSSAEIQSMKTRTLTKSIGVRIAPTRSTRWCTKISTRCTIDLRSGWEFSSTKLTQIWCRGCKTLATHICPSNLSIRACFLNSTKMTQSIWSRIRIDSKWEISTFWEPVEETFTTLCFRQNCEKVSKTRNLKTLKWQIAIRILRLQTRSQFSSFC